MTLSVSFLGGVGEIGSNCYLYETETSAIIIDAGLKFFQYDHLGIDYTIPDFSYIETIRNKLKAVVITHGHEDHTGALTYLFKRFDLPVYAGNYATRLIKHKVAESKYRPKSFNIFKDGDTMEFGDIKVESIQVTHSIPDTFFILITHNGEQYLHCGDFRIENKPLIGKAFPKNRLSKLRNSIKCLFVDTTNIFDTSNRKEELTLYNDMVDLMTNSEGRIFTTTFSTNISRIKLIIDSCIKSGRKVVIEGNSLKKNINIARDLGYLQFPKDLIVQLEHIDRYEDRELCFLVTGCQGEPNSSLSKITSMERTKLKVKYGDLFIFSSKTIPGNEKNVNKIKNEIYLNYGTFKDGIHISGHACQKDILWLINKLRPKYVVPIHGEVFNQRLLEKIIKPYEFTESIFVVNGNKISFHRDEYALKNIQIGIKYVDQRNNFEYNEEQFREKKYLARDGILIIHIIKNEITIETVGFKNTPELDIKLKRYIREQIEIIKNSNEGQTILKDSVSSIVKRFYKKNCDMKPIVKTYIMEELNGIF